MMYCRAAVEHVTREAVGAANAGVCARQHARDGENQQRAAASRQLLRQPPADARSLRLSSSRAHGGAMAF